LDLVRQTAPAEWLDAGGRVRRGLLFDLSFSDSVTERMHREPGSLFGAFWRGNEGGTADLEWLTQQFKNSPKINFRFYLDVGAEETRKTAGGPIFIEASGSFF